MFQKPTHRRSRHGCAQCKGAKIKCDQKKPACSQCASRRLQCPGYTFNLRWAPKNQLQFSNASSDSTPKRPRKTTTRRKSDQGIKAINQQVPDSDLSAVRSASDASVLGVNLGDHLDITDEVLDHSFAQELPFVSEPQGEEDFQQSSSGLGSEQWAGQILGSPAEEVGSGNQCPDDFEWTFALNHTVFDDFAPGMEADHFKAPSELAEIRLDTPPVIDLSNDLSPYEPTQNVGTQVILSRPNEIANVSSMLVDYFFREVIPLYCAWDNSENPLRLLAGSMWQSSEILFHTIQSMAGACLREHFPELSPIAIQEHSKALQLLRNGPSASSDTEENLLSLLLLGHTTSWHNPGDLAVGILKRAQEMINRLMQRGCRLSSASFFQPSIDFWAMLVSLVNGSCLNEESINEPAFVGPQTPLHDTTPHPVIGISHQLVRILINAGGLVFRYRKRAIETKFFTEQDLDFFKQCIKEARGLERQLLAYESFDPSKVADSSDPNTTADQLLKMEEAFRLTGLLQIYRVFPDLLSERYSPWNPDHILKIPVVTRPCSAEERESWLTSLAMHILDLLRGIPFESRTRCLQPVILAATSSELRCSGINSAARGLTEDSGHSPIELMRARSFVQSRLGAYRYVLPLRKVSIIQELIKNTWSALDAGDRDVYWLDVCTEYQLATVMG